MRITSLKQVTAEHVTVLFEDETEVKSTLGVVTELRLFSGKELDDREMEALIRDSRRALMREKALEIVSQRQMSAKELSRKLRDKGADEETADYCVQWILERGLIDEERYAAAIVRHYAAKGYGTTRWVSCRRIRQSSTAWSRQSSAIPTTGTRCESSAHRSTAGATAAKRSARHWNGRGRRSSTRNNIWIKAIRLLQ